MKLLPCPFCGGTEQLERDGYVIACLNCDASGPFRSFGTPKDAEERWNTRDQYCFADDVADRIIAAANAAGPTLHLEQHDAIRRAILASLAEEREAA